MMTVMIESRTALRVPQGEKLSFGTYFNAFPASYWRRWSVVDAVRLSVTLRGEGATLLVYKSMARGHAQRVDSAETSGSAGAGADRAGRGHRTAPGIAPGACDRVRDACL